MHVYGLKIISNIYLDSISMNWLSSALYNLHKVIM